MADAAPEPVAELRSVSKAFARVQAVDRVTFAALPGEVHALLGENGAGKTTAMRILAGLLAPDSGEIGVHGRSVRFRGRRDAARMGIGFVQQHFGLVDELTAAENLLLGQPRPHALVDRRRAAADLAALSERFGLDVSPEKQVAELSMAERQRLDILIALSWGASILILDEPTATLGGAEFAALAKILERLREEGVAVVYISHKLPEVTALADRVTVMRAGRVVFEARIGETDPERLATEMVGTFPERPRVTRDEPAAAVIELHGVTTPQRAGALALQDIDLVVHRHEIVGVAGVAGNGQRELARVLVGVDEPASGRVERAGRRTAYVPEDRAAEGIAAELTLADNAIVHAHRHPPVRRHGWLNRAAIHAFAGRVIDDFGVRPADPHQPAGSLSGGNQQRLVLGRELAERPDLIVAHNPTRGLDVLAATDVHGRLLQARHSGAGVVLISPDLEELLELTDRIVVLYGGRLVGSLRTAEATATRLAHLMTGVE